MLYNCFCNKIVENKIIIKPKKPEVKREFIIDFGTILVGFFVSSDISAAASNPVKHQAPRRTDRANGLSPTSLKLKLPKKSFKLKLSISIKINIIANQLLEKLQLFL